MRVQKFRSAQPLPLRGTHEGRRALHAQEGKLLLEHVGHGLAAMIMPDGKATGDAPGKSTETVAHPLADRLQCLEAQNPNHVPVPGSMDTHNNVLGGAAL